MSKINAQYNVAAPDSFAIRLAGRVRRRMYERFLALAQVSAHDRILDVGVTSDRSYDSSNYLESWYPHKANVTAVGLDDAAFLCVKFPGLQFCFADGLALPFRDNSFDVVHSSAVLEHVGGSRNQAIFLAELYRVARRVVFATTPNRWFPIEFHTSLPLVHWLPKAAFRALLRSIGHHELAQEKNLNLLSASEILGLASEHNPAACEVACVRLLGWPSNLLLVMRKSTLAANHPYPQQSVPPQR